MQLVTNSGRRAKSETKNGIVLLHLVTLNAGRPFFTAPIEDIEACGVRGELLNEALFHLERTGRIERRRAPSRRQMCIRVVGTAPLT